MVLDGGGGTIIKQAPFWGVNLSLVRNMRGVKFYGTATREFEVSDPSFIPWLGKRKNNQLNI